MALSHLQDRARNAADRAHGPLPLPGQPIWWPSDFAVRTLRLKLLLIDHMADHAACLRLRADYAEAEAVNELAWAVHTQGLARDDLARGIAARREAQAAALFAKVSDLRERAAMIDAERALRAGLIEVAKAA